MSAGNTSSTEGPDTASTGTMSTAEATRSTRSTHTQNTLILKTINFIQPENTTSIRRIYSRNTASTRHTPVAFCKQMGMELSNRCTNGQIILLTLSIHTAHIQSTPSTRSTNGRNASTTCSSRSTDMTLKCLEVHGVSTVSNPEILRVRKYP